MTGALALVLQLLIDPTAAGDKAAIAKAATYVLELEQVPKDDWRGLLARISIERKLIRDECSEGRRPRGCTMTGNARDGLPAAHIWYLPGGDRKDTLRHELRHAIRWVLGKDPNFHRGE